MLARHTIIYFGFRIIAGLLNLLSIVIFTRLLTIKQYGDYALILAFSGLVSAVVFQWLRQGLLRFLPALNNHLSMITNHQTGTADTQSTPPQIKSPYYHIDYVIETNYLNQQNLLAVIASVFIVLTGISALCAFTWICLINGNNQITTFIMLGFSLSVSLAWFELSLDIARTNLQPTRYGIMSLIKAFIALILGIIMSILGYGVVGVLIGLCLGLLVATIPTIKAWNNIKFSLDSRIVKMLLSYGFPLTATLALTFILDSTDRILLSFIQGQEAVGLYAASYSIAQQSVGIIMATLGLPIIPLVIQALERGEHEHAHDILKFYGIMLVGIGLLATVTLVSFSQPLGHLLLGSGFDAASVTLMPIVAVAVFIGCMKTAYIDIGFQIERKTYLQLLSTAIAVSVNIVLNLILIPQFGTHGAAYATLFAFAAGLAASVALRYKAYNIPIPTKEWKQLAGAAGVMLIIFLIPLTKPTLGWISLKFIIGVSCYCAIIIYFNPLQIYSQIHR